MRRKRIAFITSNPNSIYARRLMKGVFSQSRACGFDVLVFTSMVQVCHFIKDYLEGELNIYELVRSPVIDGIIVDTVSITEDHIEAVREKLLGILSEMPSVPVVSIDMVFWRIRYGTYRRHRRFRADHAAYHRKARLPRYTIPVGSRGGRCSEQAAEGFPQGNGRMRLTAE